MKTSTIEVGELVSTLSAAGVGRQLSARVCSPADHATTGDVHAGHASHAGHGDHSQHGGHGDSSADQKADMRNRFLVALLFAVPVFLYSPMGEMFGDFSAPFGLDRKLFLFVVATGAIAYPVWPFLVAAWRAARNRVANMATLIVLSVGTGYVFSVGATFFYKGEVFYEASAVLLVFLLLGHWLEMCARAGASDAIRALMDLAPPMATVMRDGVETKVSTAEVRAGEIVVIKPGDKIPVDGEITEGSSQVDESMLTGESMPVKKVPGNPAIGATTNKSGSFRYKATKVGADTALAQIVKLVREAQNSKAPGQLLADQASQWLVLAAIAIGLLTFGVWFWVIGEPLLFALTLTITVFVIACPDALGLATPMAIMVGTGLGAMNGILFKNASALENATKLTVVVFDKTGTLTLGQPDVVEMVTAPNVSEAQLLAVAAGVEKFSEHPLAKAVLKRVGTAPVEVATDFGNIDGQGARATPTSKATIAKLQERGVKVAMMTGDNQATAERIGKEWGIDIVLAEVLPGQKAAKIKELQDQGNKVGMVGDGINDAPALTQADVGFAIGAGTDVAMESAQVVLMKSDPYDVVGAIELSRATLRKMHQNLWWAVGYNVIAALSMSGSSALVAINALLLKRTKLAGIRSTRLDRTQPADVKLAAGASA